MVRTGVAARPQDAARSEARDLRRARRRSGVDSLLREGRPRLRQRLAVPDARGAAGRRAGGAVGEGRRLSEPILRSPERPRPSRCTSIDRAWLDPASGVDALGRPRRAVDSRIADPLRHVRLPSAVGRGRDERAAVSRRSKPYDGYLYVVLHGHRLSRKGDDGLHDARHRLLPRPELSRHRPRRPLALDSRASRALPAQPQILGEGPVALFHRIVDRWSTTIGRRSRSSRSAIDELEDAVFSIEPSPDARPRHPRSQKRHVSALRRIAIPQRDVDRPAGAPRVRRHQHRDGLPVPRRLRPLVRLNDEAMMLQDRITGILEAHCRTSATGSTR